MKLLHAALPNLLILPSLVSAHFTITVCFQLNDGSGNVSPVEGALVKCYDDDYFPDPDDGVGPANGVVTDANGCASLEDNQWWLENPDIFCRIEANGGCFAEQATVVENDHTKYNDLNFGKIDLQFDMDYCGDFDLGSNGCGVDAFPDILNDVFTDVSGFESQCAAHDTCYSDCTKRRSKCDDEFLDDMLNTCANQESCEALARIFYEAVDNFGLVPCKQSRKGFCPRKSVKKCKR